MELLSFTSRSPTLNTVKPLNLCIIVFFVFWPFSLLCSMCSTQLEKSEAQLNSEYGKVELWNVSSSLINLLKFQYYLLKKKKERKNESSENYSCEKYQLINQQANPFLIIWGWCFICKRVIYHKKGKWKKRLFQETRKSKSILVKTFLRDFFSNSNVTLLLLCSFHCLLDTNDCNANL